MPVDADLNVVLTSLQFVSTSEQHWMAARTNWQFLELGFPRRFSAQCTDRSLPTNWSHPTPTR